MPADAPDGLCPKCLVQAGPRDPSTPALGNTVRIAADAFLPAPTHGPELERLGGYRIVRLLGKGGMGAVYEAEEMESGRRVALKVLSQGLDSPEARRRFLREGRLAASVNHPNTVYVFGTDEIDGQPVIVMELVSCGTLQERVKDRKPMAVADAVDAILQVIAGLEAAAALGVLHRDVKPSNCFVETDGTVKMGDFGLSVPIAVRGETKLTMAGAFMGTPAFSSPEQLRGDEFTVQGDIYAVGVTLYYLLTGRTPFEGDDLVRLLATVLERPAESPAVVRADLPKGLCRAVLHCLEKQPAKRFKNYALLRESLLPYSSAATSPATLNLRFVAACIDATLLAFASMTMAALWPRSWVAASPQAPGFLMSLVGGMVKVIYFALLEGLWGASLGKRLCRLRVAGPNRALPGVARAFWRAVIVEWVPALPTFVFFWFSYLPHPSESTVTKFSALAYSRFAILALLFCTARRRNGFAAVQDLLTRTRVIRRSSHAARPSLETAKEEPAVPDAASRLGPYHILETLTRSEAGEMLVGFDTRLLRKVWIRKLPPGAPPLAPSLRNLARVGRLRWLNGKRSPEECWDAYEAAPGKPLLELARRPQPWNRVRFWLLDLAEEMNMGLKDQTLPEILQLDRVWITADGRAKLLDFPAPEIGAVKKAPPVVRGSTPQLFLYQVAVAALAGHPEAAADAQPALVAVPLPFHARELLGEMQVGLSPGQLSDRIRPLLSNLAFVSRGRRLGLIAACAAVPLLSILMIYLGIVLAQVMSGRFRDVNMAALHEALSQLSELQLKRNLPGGLDGAGAAFSMNQLGSGLTWNGIAFKFGPTNASDVVAATGQTIVLPAGHFTNLTLLATAVQGNQPSQVITVNYADNTTSNWTQSFSDWLSPQNYSRESNALTMDYMDRHTGAQDSQPCHLYGYSLALDSNRPALSLTLPRNPNIVVLALATQPPATTVDLSPWFNQSNGIVADGSAFSIRASPRAREAYETYIAGRFRQTITNPAVWNSVPGLSISQKKRTAAEQLIARRPAPSDMELKQAAAEVEPNLKVEAPGGPMPSFDIFSKPLVLYLAANPFVILGAIPSFLAALFFRGGLVLRMLGLEVVKKNGAKASRLLIFSRSFVAWCPILMMGPVAQWLFPSAGLSQVERALMSLGYIIVTAVLMICAAMLPERGLQDRIAGTCLVPRE